MRVKELFAFIKERHAIYERRLAGAPKPWTRDPILQRYRFCNVYRELDTVTAWIRENWRDPYAENPDVWFAMVQARLLNLPASLEAVTPPLPWSAVRFKRVLARRKAEGHRVFNGAYMVRADAVETGLKADYLADFVLSPMWKARKLFTPGLTFGSLHTFHSQLMEFRDMGSFMAGQVVADVKFTALLKNALDWWTWAVPGPGSMRGLNRVFNEPVEWKLREELWQADFKRIQIKIDPLVKKADMPRISAQDLQNCLCEFDKYERVRMGTGRPKQLYPGGA